MIYGWKSLQIDFVFAFLQADIEQEMYMELPLDIKTKKDYVLQLPKNLYSQKQASWVFYLHLKKRLEKIGFQPSQIDEGLLFRGTTIFVFMWIMEYFLIQVKISYIKQLRICKMQDTILKSKAQ